MDALVRHAEAGDGADESVRVDGDRVGGGEQGGGSLVPVAPLLRHHQHVRAPHLVEQRPHSGAKPPVAVGPQEVRVQRVRREPLQLAAQVPPPPQATDADPTRDPAAEDVVHLHSLDRLRLLGEDVRLVPALGQPPRPPLRVHTAPRADDGDTERLG